MEYAWWRLRQSHRANRPHLQHHVTIKESTALSRGPVLRSLHLPRVCTAPLLPSAHLPLPLDHPAANLLHTAT